MTKTLTAIDALELFFVCVPPEEAAWPNRQIVQEVPAQITWRHNKVVCLPSKR